MSHSVWEKMAYDDLGKHADEIFHLQQPTPNLFETTMPQSKRTVRFLSLSGDLVGCAPGYRRLGILADRQDLLELCRCILEDEG